MPESNASYWPIIGMDEFTHGFCQALFFTETIEPQDEEFAENYMPSDLPREDLQRIKDDCAKFQVENATAILRACETRGYNIMQAGRDFLYTRNGHGCGFWDGDIADEQIAKELTKAAEKYGEIGLYLGDDELPHLY